MYSGPILILMGIIALKLVTRKAFVMDMPLSFSISSGKRVLEMDKMAECLLTGFFGQSDFRQGDKVGKFVDGGCKASALNQLVCQHSRQLTYVALHVEIGVE